MRTANRPDPKRLTRLGIVAWAFALAATATACSDPPPMELALLQRDHERCVASEQDSQGEVRYQDYRDCMDARGWSDPDLTQRG
jgi:hypothetical protein